MKELRYEISINSSREEVWDLMLGSDSYNKWAISFSTNSMFEGEWKQGSSIKFIDPDIGGTKAFLEVFKPFEQILARHTTLISVDGSEDTDSDEAKTWIGTTENYSFSESEGRTRLVVTMNTDDKYIEMFDASWPKALTKLKHLCEE